MADAASPDRPFSLDDAKPLKVIREKAKHRWLVCHEDSHEGDANPRAKTNSSQRVNRVIGAAAIIVNKEDKVLVGLRSGSHGAGTWALPGGHIDDRQYPEGEDDTIANLTLKDAVDVETQFETTRREVEEESGLVIKDTAKHVHTTWDYFEENKTKKPGFEHYNTFFMWCELADPDAQPELKEPEKCQEWRFISWEELREMWKDNPLIEDEQADAPDGPAVGRNTKDHDDHQKMKFFLPLAKLVRDHPTLESLRPRDDKVSGEQKSRV